MPDSSIYTPENGVVVLHDEDYVKVHRLEFQRFVNSIKTVNDLGEQWTRTTLELQAMTKERDKWRKIADRLVNGAEQQIDDLGGLPKNPNAAWISAWRDHEEAMLGE